MYQAYDFEDYKLKVNRYIERNRDTLAIYKLRNNIPLNILDHESLEKIFTGVEQQRTINGHFRIHLSACCCVKLPVT